MSTIRYIFFTSLINYHFNPQMSIVPLMFRDWWDEWDRPSRLLDQHFGMGLKRDELLSSLSTLPSSSLFRNSYFRPWRTSLTRQESASTINLTKEKFEVSGNIQLQNAIKQVLTYKFARLLFGKKI